MRRYPVSTPNKPPLGVDVNRATALGRDLVAAFLLNEFAGVSPAELITQKKGSFAGSPIWTGGRTGAVIRTLATTDTVVLGANSALLPTQNCTIVMSHFKTDATLRNTAHFGVNLAGEACDALCPYGDGRVYFDWGGFTEGTNRLSVAGLPFTPMQRDVWAFSTGVRGMKIYRNGALVASNTANPTRTSGSASVVLNSAIGGSGDLANYELWMVWWRQLSDADASAITLNPYQIFDVPMRRPTGSATGMAGAATLALATAGTLDFGPLMLGGSSVLAAATSAALTTAITMQGAATLSCQTDLAALFAGKKATRLSTCGRPLSTSCEDWLLK